MQVVLKNDYVYSYSLVGNIIDGVEVDTPTDLGHFEEHYQAYRVDGDVLIFDSEKEAAIEIERRREELRELRETECFSYVDRSQFWYNSLTSKQLEELQTWYEAWLFVTETLVIPDKPDWL